MQTVRLLRWSDAWFCYKLAKDPTVREASLDSRPPMLFGHLRWMRRWIRDKDRIAWIILRSNHRAGLIRYDRSTFEIGIAITPKDRNQGVALEALLAASPYCHYLAGDVRAIIKEGNVGSVALFREAGYREVHADSGHAQTICMRWRPE